MAPLSLLQFSFLPNLQEKSDNGYGCPPTIKILHFGLSKWTNLFNLLNARMGQA